MQGVPPQSDNRGEARPVPWPTATRPSGGRSARVRRGRPSVAPWIGTAAPGRCDRAARQEGCGSWGRGPVIGSTVDSGEEVRAEVARWLSPRQSWPKHPDAAPRKALREARAQGWWFKPSPGGHLFGMLTCLEPTGERRAGSEDWCFLRVLTTARPGPERTAHIIREHVRECAHALPSRGRSEAAPGTRRPVASCHVSLGPRRQARGRSREPDCR